MENINEADLEPPNCQVCQQPITSYETTTRTEEVRPMVRLWPGGPVAPDYSALSKVRVTGRTFTAGCGHVQPDPMSLVWIKREG